MKSFMRHHAKLVQEPYALFDGFMDFSELLYKQAVRAKDQQIYACNGHGHAQELFAVEAN